MLARTKTTQFNKLKELKEATCMELKESMTTSDPISRENQYRYKLRFKVHSIFYIYSILLNFSYQCFIYFTHRVCTYFVRLIPKYRIQVCPIFWSLSYTAFRKYISMVMNFFFVKVKNALDLFKLAKIGTNVGLL